MATSNDIIKQLKDEIDKEGGDGESLTIAKEGEGNAQAKEPEVQAADPQAGDAEESSAQAQEGADTGTQDDAEAAGEGVGATGEDEGDALSDDTKKRGKAFGAMRQELREAKERADKLEQARQEMAERVARLEGRAETAAPAAKVVEDTEPDALMYPDDHREWRERKLEARLAKAEAIAAEAQGFANYQKETRGVQLLESTFKSANPKEDYDGAVQFMVERERALKKLMNPKLTDAQADAQTESEKVQLFKDLYSKGHDPAKMIVDMAKVQGFTPGTAGKGKEVVNKTNLQQLAENQRKSTNLMGGSPAGKSKTTTTSDDVLGMGFSKLMKLSSKERERLAGDNE